MGTTLQNGVYLPNEGERNCYAGLKTNWEILDQKVADVTALQQAVAGALHREIVESLPTTDIDPNTIYMILSGTSATENVYDEYMYVNNAWELIGTSATDLTNYYTKGDVDGLLLLKANASDLTSHTGDTTIHVTASDKAKWDTVALIKQLRLVNTQVGSATTIAFANIDDTNGIKVGDKCMDLDAKMFEITAVDTTNQTVTVGTALIDLALDANVVHTSGNETVGGNKTFSDNLSIYNSDNSVDTPVLNIKTSKYVKGDTTNTDTMRINFLDSNGNNVASVYANKNIGGSQYLAFQVYTTDNNNANITSTINYYISKSGDKSFVPYEDGQISLGGSVRRWKSVYATNYYYGSDNVEFSTKFVTTDTSQTISGDKTFNGNTNCVGELNQIAPFKMTSDTSFATGSKNTTIYDQDGFQCSNEQIIYNNSKNIRRSWIVNNNGSGTTISAGFNLILSASGGKVFYPISDSDTDNGTSSAYWKNTYTKKINGVEPSSLSLPDLTNAVDISSYITDLAGLPNVYSPPANGYIVLRSTTANVLGIVENTTGMGSYSRGTNQTLAVNLPVVKNTSISIYAICSSLTHAKFIPCQGNV